jgi:hypothetical protein
MKFAENSGKRFTIQIPSVEEDVPPVWSTTRFLFEHFNARRIFNISNRTPHKCASFSTKLAILLES